MRGFTPWEAPLSFNSWLRQIHRWLSIVFTLAVIINVVALVLKAQAVWVGLLALFPLIFLLLTGLYLFALPMAQNGAAVEGLGHHAEKQDGERGNSRRSTH